MTHGDFNGDDITDLAIAEGPGDLARVCVFYATPELTFKEVPDRIVPRLNFKGDWTFLTPGADVNGDGIHDLPRRQ